MDGRQHPFDTGNDLVIFANDVKAKGVDLATIDFVVMSHRHSDHMGGLSQVLSVNPTVKIYAPKESFGIYGSSLPSSFYRRAEGLPPEMRYYDGSPPEVMKFGNAWPSANIELIDKTTEIAARHSPHRPHLRQARYVGAERTFAGNRHSGRHRPRCRMFASRHRY